MKDFSKIRKPIEFKIDDDRFTCVRAIPAEVFVVFLAEVQSVDENAESKRFFDLNVSFFHEILDEPSFKTFRSRLGDRANPIEMDQVNDITEWLMGEYGMRPTPASPSSSDGSSTPLSGPILMEKRPPEESTFSPSPSTGSSMPSITNASSV